MPVQYLILQMGYFNFAVSILKLSWLVVNLLRPGLLSTPLCVFLVVILLSHILKLVIKCLVWLDGSKDHLLAQ